MNYNLLLYHYLNLSLDKFFFDFDVISSYDNDKKLKSKGSIVKFNLNTENNNNITKGNLIEPLIRKERSSSVKKNKFK